MLHEWIYLIAVGFFHYIFRWSFGILLWEIFTLGGSPYPALPMKNLMSFLEEGNRMERPEHCPNEMYNIMLNCWNRGPHFRPTFVQLSEQIEDCLRHNVSVSKLSSAILSRDCLKSLFYFSDCINPIG